MSASVRCVPLRHTHSRTHSHTFRVHSRASGYYYTMSTKYSYKVLSRYYVHVRCTSTMYYLYVPCTCILQHTGSGLYYTDYRVYIVQLHVHCTMYIVHSTCTLYEVHRTMYKVLCTRCTCTMYLPPAPNTHHPPFISLFRLCGASVV